MKKQIMAALSVSLWIAGCSPSYKPQNKGSSSSTLAAEPPALSSAPVATSPSLMTPSLTPLTSTKEAGAMGIGPDGKDFCSRLDISNITWPMDVKQVNWREAFALALNVSGSFEGSHGWQNLTNNFDGQGLSYGLLNQCLGQGSLQPLLIQMQSSYSDQMSASLSPDHMKSLTDMLNTWQSQMSIADVADLGEYGLNAELDDPNEIRQLTGWDANAFHVQSVDRNSMSVQWAVDNLYKGSKFIATWSSELKDLAISSGYRSIQVGAAVRIHRKALGYFLHFQLTQLRSYIFLFDIAVQGGGLPSVDIKNLDAKFTANPKMSETDKLNAILDARLTHVKRVWRADFSSRKQSLINGTGVVHGGSRNYPKEYCAAWQTPMI